MKITLTKISVRDLTKGYINNQEEGVYALEGKLNIRPKYQREFIYGEKERNAVIHTVLKGYPLNLIYWAARINDKNEYEYEVIDGQQRIMSICEYVTNNFSVEDGGLTRYNFNNLPYDHQNKILNYELMVYICQGEESEKLEWFKTINIAGKPLNDQELRNAVYSGDWLESAKKYFSKSNCPAYMLGSKYISGSPIRQDYLETVIKWISQNHIESYMSEHQHDQNANELIKYFESVIFWVRKTFKIERKEMKSVDWATLYRETKAEKFDTDLLESRIKELMRDDEVTNKKGIYSYVLLGNDKYLNLRSFTDNQKLEAYELQEGFCAHCGNHFKNNEMQADHIVPWSKGGKTVTSNCQMLCVKCNNAKSNKAIC